MNSKRTALFYKTRPLVVFSIFFGLGTYLGIPIHPNWAITAAALIALCFAFFKKSRWMVFAAAFFIGMLLSANAAHPYVPAQGAYDISGIITGDVRHNDKTGQVRLKLEDVMLNGQSMGISGYWSFYQDEGQILPDLSDGDRVTFHGTLYHPAGQSNPYGFDYKMYLYQNGMSVGLYGNESLSVDQNVGRGLKHEAYSAQHWLFERLKQAMGEDAGLAAAMTLGVRSLIPEEDTQAFRLTGTAHILSISGLHVAYLIAVISFLFKLFNVPSKAQWPFLFVFLVGYSFLTGLSAAVIRSAILALVLLLARTVRRPYDSLTALSAAFTGILFIRPLDIISPGFIMTFAAVLGIIMLNKPIQRLLQFLPKWLCDGLAVSLGASVGILLPVMHYYYQVQWLSPFVNLLMIPWSGMLTVLFFLTLFFPFLGGFSVWMTKLFVMTVRLISQAPFLSIEAFSPPWYIAPAFMVFMVLLSGYVTIKGKKRLAGLATVSVAMVVGLAVYFYTPPRYILFANGQADGAILEKAAYTMVVDVGEEGTDMAAYLKSRGRAVDDLVISHLHSDHVMGLKTFIENQVPVKRIYLPVGYETFDWDEGCLPLVESLGADIHTLQKGDTLPYARVLWPVRDAPPLSQDSNDLSLSLLITLDGVRILSLGDMTVNYENYAAVGCDVLKASHHGSTASMGEKFLYTANPAVVLISCRQDANLPSTQTLDSLYDRGMAVYRTDVSGALAVLPGSNRFTIETFLP